MNHSKKDFEKSIRKIKEEYRQKIKELEKRIWSDEGNVIKKKYTEDLSAVYQTYADWMEEENYDKVEVAKMRVKAGISELRYTIIHKPTRTRITKAYKTPGNALSNLYVEAKSGGRGFWFSILIKRARETPYKIDINDYVLSKYYNYSENVKNWPLSEIDILVEEVRIIEIPNNIMDEYKDVLT